MATELAGRVGWQLIAANRTDVQGFNVSLVIPLKGTDFPKESIPTAGLEEPEPLRVKAGWDSSVGILLTPGVAPVAVAFAQPATGGRPPEYAAVVETEAQRVGLEEHGVPRERIFVIVTLGAAAAYAQARAYLKEREVTTILPIGILTLATEWAILQAQLEGLFDDPTFPFEKPSPATLERLRKAIYELQLAYFL